MVDIYLQVTTGNRKVKFPETATVVHSLNCNQAEFEKMTSLAYYLYFLSSIQERCFTLLSIPGCLAVE